MEAAKDGLIYLQNGKTFQNEKKSDSPKSSKYLKINIFSFWYCLSVEVNKQVHYENEID